MSNKSRNRAAEARENGALNQMVEQSAQADIANAETASSEAETPRPAILGEFSDVAKITEVDTGPEWQNVAYTLLNEFRNHGAVFEFLRSKSTGLTDPTTGLSVLGTLTHADRARIVELLMPFTADARVAKFCGVAEKTGAN